jgi:P pilus assembly chaperone PapD
MKAMNNPTLDAQMLTLRSPITVRVALAIAVFAAWCAALPIAHANMVIETTRIIYPESRRDVSFRVMNTSKDRPAFVQMWLDDGNALAAPEDVVTPFNLSPPVARLKPDGTQVVRLLYTGEPLPRDRESVFWFNMLEIPQRSKEDNRLTFAVRTRIKVFFRPASIKADPTALMDNLNWTLREKDGRWSIETMNPTPVHMSFFSMELGHEGRFTDQLDGGMALPLGRTEFNLPEDRPPSGPFSRIRVNFINDFGGPVTKEFPLGSSK